MMKRSIKIFDFICLFIIIIGIIFLYNIQSKIFFHPWHDENSYNQLLINNQFREIKIENNSKLLYGWLKYNNYSNTNEKAPLLIFFMGNGQNSSNTCINFLNNNVYKYFEGYNVMIIDYPGYGLSEGKASEKSMFDMAEEVYDYAYNLDYVDKENIVIMGFSIGTGVATYISSVRDVNGLILIAPYDEALSLYNDNVNIFYGPLKLLTRYKFKSSEYAKKVKVSPLIITSYDDEIIDYNFSLNLSKQFNSVYNTIILDNNVRHNDYFLQEDVLINIYNYLKMKI